MPVRTLRPGTLIDARDLVVANRRPDGALEDPALAIGMEAAVALYPNRPIYAGDLAPPTLVARNQIVRRVVDTGGLRIVSEGRALDRAPLGGMVRVMNLASRTTVSGTVEADGSVRVGPYTESGS
jgi:flagella basal body P-ring formation protein FlgA